MLVRMKLNMTILERPVSKCTMEHLKLHPVLLPNIACHSLEWQLARALSFTSLIIGWDRNSPPGSFALFMAWLFR